MKREHEEALIYEALSHVETPGYDIASAVRRQRVENVSVPTRRRVPRAALAAACLVLVLAVGAAAVGLSGNWYRFFGAVPENAVTTVGVSQTSGDYTLTIEDAMVDNNGAVLLFALTRADGGDVDPEASLQAGGRWTKFLVDGERFGGGGGFSGQQISEDGKTLYLWYEVRNNALQGDGGPMGKILTFQADCVAKGVYHMGEGIPTSLAPLAELEVTEVPFYGVEDAAYTAALNAALAGQEISLPLPLDHQFPAFRIRGAAVTKDGLSIAVSSGTAVSGDLSCTGIWPDQLIDTRTGAAYEGHEGLGVELPDGTRAMLWSFRDCPLTAEDLPYLELAVDYEVDQILSEEPFSLEFAADSGAAIVLPLDRDVEITGLTLHVTELRLSALGLTLNFTDTAAFDLYETGGAPVLELKDGSTIQTEWDGGNGRRDGTCAVSFSVPLQPEEQVSFDRSEIASVNPRERAFFDTDQIALVRFGDLEVPVG